MGTRHLIAIQANGKYPLAQYGQWDGYPGGQGAAILAFLVDGDVAGLKANIGKLYEPTDDQMEAFYARVGHDTKTSNGWIDYGKSKKFTELYPTLSRDTGSKVLALIASSPDDAIPTTNQIAFAGNSLFCEWAYVIDFDKNTFEVFKGFNRTRTPVDSRFPSGADWLESKDGYEPVALMKSYRLDDLPTEDGFLSDLHESEEDEVA